MKSIVFLFVCLFLITPVVADDLHVFKCSPLTDDNTSFTSTSPTPSNWKGKVEWQTTAWYASGKKVPIKGLAVCSKDRGVSASVNTVSPGAVGLGYNGLQTVGSASDTTNKCCWCKIISPVVSYWVVNKEYTTASQCAYNCAYECANNIDIDSKLGPRLLQTLQN